MDKSDFQLEIKSYDDEQGIFEGYASVFGNQDYQGDVVEKGAFAKSLHDRQQVPILWQHNPGNPVGITLAISEDDYGLRVKGKLVLDSPRGKEAYALLRAGAICGLSIGYDAVRHSYDTARNTRHLQEIKLWELSLVTFPANPAARVDGVKSEAVSIKSLLDEIRNWLRKNYAAVV
jgi:HK97 family phage prohead protease